MVRQLKTTNFHMVHCINEIPSDGHNGYHDENSQHNFFKSSKHMVTGFEILDNQDGKLVIDDMFINDGR